MFPQFSIKDSIMIFYLLYTPIATLLFIVPILLWCVDKSKADAWKIIGLFLGYSLIADLLLFFPFFTKALQFGIESWAIGKTFNIIFSLAFYWIFRQYFEENRFIRFKQENRLIEIVGMICLAVLLLSLLVFTIDILFINALWRPETTNFQDVFFTMTLPGIEEEIAYRGIMLGLLATALKSRKIFGGRLTFHPGIWITGFLFGLAHGFRILPGWELYWDWVDVSTSTVLSGAFFAWLTLKSKSIVTPILIHNSIFFIVSLVDNLHR